MSAVLSPDPTLSLEEAYLQQLGLRIRAQRQDQKIGLEGLADTVGIHRTHLWKIEKGQLNAGIYTYERIARALGSRLQELLPD
ncbi:helix-turn-helix domain-containing protein [Deinococcus sp. QL22]|uniref:helix-turn-helix domain-containing protein n=1 Tax=Deinococcus sp. QL22 TaxID=2939437 RepID=UPI0020180074|nr:helix-turn-helix domain-containing protein [Deinococcus sp. QL22]UQN08448.1 helix-turn-helix domain-containing protein [Deinococcus sp. QL22]